MSDEERRFTWNLACALAVKHPAIAFRTYHIIRSFVTFHGIFMVPGYDLGAAGFNLGEGSIWRLKTVISDDDVWSWSVLLWNTFLECLCMLNK